MRHSKSILRGKFIVIQSYLKKQEKHRIDNLTLHLKQLETEQQQQKKNSRIWGGGREVGGGFGIGNMCTPVADSC